MDNLTTLLRKYLLVIGLIAGFAALSLAQGVDEVCTGQTKKYKANGSYPDSEFTWKVEGGTIAEQSALGDTIIVVWGNTPGTWWVKLVEHNFGCQSDTIELQVNLQQIPSINLDPLVLLCTGQTVDLDAGPGFESYLWSTDQTTQFITISEGGTYWVQAQSFCGPISDTVVVELLPLPIAEAGDDVYIKVGESATLTATYFSEYSYSWEPPEWLSAPNWYTTQATPDVTTTFNLTVTDQFGCTNTDFVTVFVDNEVLTIYNAFTPNGDGFNDTWVIDNIDLFPDAEITVFDRRSNKVYHSVGYQNNWDGTHYKTGRQLPYGTYYYIISIPSAEKTFRGTVSIIR
jgi:gliding motility-associated-like protein